MNKIKKIIKSFVLIFFRILTRIVEFRIKIFSCVVHEVQVGDDEAAGPVVGLLWVGIVKLVRVVRICCPFCFGFCWLALFLLIFFSFYDFLFLNGFFLNTIFLGWEEVLTGKNFQFIFLQFKYSGRCLMRCDNVVVNMT
jgi:hypothetical protein